MHQPGPGCAALNTQRNAAQGRTAHLKGKEMKKMNREGLSAGCQGGKGHGLAGWIPDAGARVCSTNQSTYTAEGSW